MFATCTGKAMHHGWLLGVVIPARDEEAHIEDVLANLPPMVDLAVVINDGSTDNTGVLARQTDAPCKVVVLEGNGDGVGASIDRGHQHLLSEWRSPFISVVMAGDGQMNPDDMEALVQPIAANQADHVKGNRGLHAKGYNRMPMQRQRATAVLSLFTTLAAGQPIGDPQCGYTATSGSPPCGGGGGQNEEESWPECASCEPREAKESWPSLGPFRKRSDGATGGVNNSVQVGFRKARNGVRYAVLWPFLSKPMHVQHGRMFVDAFRVR